jgi:uncharacterized membrane protein
MLEFENTIRIHRPIADVYRFLSNLENIPKWNYYVLEVKKTSEGPASIGSTYHQVRKTDQQDLRIIDLEPNHTIRVKTLPNSSPKLEMRFTLSEDEDSTHLRDEWKLETGQPALLEKLAAWKVKSAVAENLAKLKELLENGHVILQDGRRASQ